MPLNTLNFDFGQFFEPQSLVSIFRILALILVGLLGLMLALQRPSVSANADQTNAESVQTSIHLDRVGTYTGEGAEILAYDEASERLFVTSGSDVIEVLDISDPHHRIYTRPFPWLLWVMEPTRCLCQF